MTSLEALLVIIIIALIAFVIYYYLTGSSGKMSITKPMESRVDEYLERQFELMIDEWSLINRSKLQSFREAKDQTLVKDEARVAALKDFREPMGENLGKLRAGWMLWKNKPGRSETKGSRKDPDLFPRVRNDVTVMRKQGEPPEKDASTFSRYHCDLCNSTFPSTELKQCTLCGRWACNACWPQEYYICNSCNGILRLHLLQGQEKGRLKE